MAQVFCTKNSVVQVVSAPNLKSPPRWLRKMLLTVTPGATKLSSLPEQSRVIKTGSKSSNNNRLPHRDRGRDGGRRLSG